MKLFATLLYFLLAPLVLLAQSNFKAGYVVTLKGDTLKGYIENKELDKNPKEVRFKKTADNKHIETYNPKNAKAFAITNFEYFQRFILPVSLDKVDLNSLATQLDTSVYIDTVFLQISAKGAHLTMFKYTDNIKPRYYIMETGEKQPVELIYHAWYNTSESSAVKYINRYRGQLSYLAQKYKTSTPKLERQIFETNYVEPELIAIVEAINGASSTQFVIQSTAGSRLFIGLGANYSSLKLTQASGTTYGAGNIANLTNVYPKISLGIDFFPNKITQSLIIRFELSGTGNQYSVTFNNSSAIPQSTSSLNFTQYNGTFIPQLIFNLVNSENFKFFIGAGAGFNFSMYNKYQYVTKYSGSFPDDIQNNYPPFQNFWISFPLRAGIAVSRRIEVNLCYIPSASLTSDSVSPMGNVKSYQAGINYLFGK